MLKAHSLGLVEEGILIASVLMDICVSAFLPAREQKEKTKAPIKTKRIILLKKI